MQYITVDNLPTCTSIDLDTWSEYSSLLEHFTDEDDDEEIFDRLDKDICLPWVMGHIEEFILEPMQQRQYDKYGPLVIDKFAPYERYNIWLKFWNALDYLHIEKLLAAFAHYFISNKAFPPLTDSSVPPTVWMYIKSTCSQWKHQNLYTHWFQSFFIEELFDYWASIRRTPSSFNPRLYHPDLFWNGKPDEIWYYVFRYGPNSSRDGKVKSVQALYHNHSHLGPGRIDRTQYRGCFNKQISWWYTFWDILTASDWDADKFNVMMPWIMETNIFAMWGLGFGSEQICPVVSLCHTGVSFGTDNSVINNQKTLHWIKLLYAMNPYIFLHERRNDGCPLLVSIIRHTPIIDSLIDVIPRDYKHKEKEGRLYSLIDYAAYYRINMRSINRYIQEGFRPTDNIFYILSNDAYYGRHFITGWYNILSMPNMPKARHEDKEHIKMHIDMLRAASKNPYGGNNIKNIARQLRDILAWQIHMNYIRVVDIWKKAGIEHVMTRAVKNIREGRAVQPIAGQLRWASSPRATTENCCHWGEQWRELLADVEILSDLEEKYPTWTFDFHTAQDEVNNDDTLPSYINGFMKNLTIK